MQYDVGGAALAALVLMMFPASASAASMYSRSSPVLILDKDNFNQKVLNSKTATVSYSRFFGFFIFFYLVKTMETFANILLDGRVSKNCNLHVSILTFRRTALILFL